MEQVSKEPLILLYCAATTIDDFNDFCYNFTKSYQRIVPGNATTYELDSRKYRKEDFQWGYIAPYQHKNESLTLVYNQQVGTEVAFCAQSWNYQAMDITYSICWKYELMPEPKCLPLVAHHNISSIIGLVPPDYPTDEPLEFTMTWTVPSDLRIFTAILGNSEAVLALCN